MYSSMNRTTTASSATNSSSSTNRNLRMPSPFRSINKSSSSSSLSNKSTINSSSHPSLAAKIVRYNSRSSSRNNKHSSSHRSSNTPLAALAGKFDQFRKRMSSINRKGASAGNSRYHQPSQSHYEDNRAKLLNHNASSTSHIHDARLYHQKAHSNGDHPPHSEAMYSQAMEGITKITSSSRDDATTITSSSTQPSFSHDEYELSTVSEDNGTYSYHSFPAGKEMFTVDKKYSMIRTIGSGAYGVVISAKNFERETNVAIKMIPRAFHDEIDAKRILREIKLLKHFRHENIISILDMMPPIARNVEDFNDVYIVTDLMETDLHRIIYSKQSLSIEHVQYFLYQILRALKYIHSANVLHRDLKPSNLLVNSNCDLKVCDFGLARGITSTHDAELESGNGGSMLLTEYVVTRWYRAPEIMLACHEYSKPSDIWSVGCIFAELLGRKPFFPGDDYIDQLTIITEKLGKLPEEDLDFVTSEKGKRFMRKLPNTKPVYLPKQFPNANPEAIDLLRKMLQIHPRKRINVVEALEHPFFSSLHNPEDEPVATHGPFDFSFEDEKLHRVRLQELIWQEVADFRPSCLPILPRRDGTRSFCRRLYHN